MATVFKTPGVYVEEIPKLPPSVAQVETAIPAFVGYTDKAEKQGNSLIMKPTRISSLLEFQEFYGGDNAISSISVTVDENNNFAVTSTTIPNTIRYLLYDSLRLFFDNGGGDCYIVSVGLYGTAPVYGDENASPPTGLRGGVKALEKYDEPTIILFPDAINVVVNGNDDPGFYSLQQMALEQCSNLQDRVGLFDLKENINNDLDTAISNFRNNIGINNLKYGTAYTPYIEATYPRDIDIAQFENGIVNSGSNPLTLKDLSSDSEHLSMIDNYDAANKEVTTLNSSLDAIKKANESLGGSMGDFDGSATAAATLKKKFLFYKKTIDNNTDPGDAVTAITGLFNFIRNSLMTFQDLDDDLDANSSLIKKDLNTYALSNNMWRGAASGIIAIDKNSDARNLRGGITTGAVHALYVDDDGDTANNTWLGGTVPSITATTKDYGDHTDNANHPSMTKQIANDLLPEFEKLIAFAEALESAADSYMKAAQDQLYEKHPMISSIVTNITQTINTMPPSSSIAGAYAKVDNTRGVWKAPANVSLNSVKAPSVVISHDDQANINVDAVAGKSINAIRTFTGKGTMVWGARTLAGNDNEWRYISVRRFFNMVEESCKKSTEPFVFEPNDSKTWVKVQTMIENFLTNLWRQGALQGAKAEHAFYVAVGLGKTMSAQDILEGRMIVEIGMAVVRPAEFIILRFSHKLAES